MIINYSEIKRQLDDGKWSVDPAPNDDDSVIHSVLAWLQKQTFSTLLIKQMLNNKFVEGNGMDFYQMERKLESLHDEQCEIVALIDDEISKERLSSRGMEKQFGINVENYYFYIS